MIAGGSRDQVARTTSECNGDLAQRVAQIRGLLTRDIVAKMFSPRCLLMQNRGLGIAAPSRQILARHERPVIGNARRS